MSGGFFFGPERLTTFEKDQQLAASPHFSLGSHDDEVAWPSGAGEFVHVLRELSRKYDVGSERGHTLSPLRIAV
jgi:hypothetical protein